MLAEANKLLKEKTNLNIKYNHKLMIKNKQTLTYNMPCIQLTSGDVNGEKGNEREEKTEKKREKYSIAMLSILTLA